MNNLIENVSWQGYLCPLDSKPKLFETCFNCKHDVCDIPVLRSMGKPFPVYEDEYHVTELVGPPLIMKFKRENPYYMEPDNALFMMIGTAVHEKIDRENGSLTDFTKLHEYKIRYGLDPYTIVGTMDYVDFTSGLIQDYKCLGAWKTDDLRKKALNGTLNEDEYGLQLNGYRAWGFPEATQLRLHCIIRDYNGRTAGTYKLESQQMRINVPIVDNGYMDDLARTNIEESLKDVPRMCTPEQRWVNRKTGKFVRCASFCPVRTCPNYGGPQYNPEDVT